MKFKQTTLICCMGMLSFEIGATTAPSAGQLLQQQRDEIILPQVTDLKLEQPEQSEPTKAEGSLSINKIEIIGNRQISTEKLHSLVAEAEGKTLSFQELQSYVKRITDYYRSQGYSLTFAYLPQQKIDQAKVQIGVLEVRYDQPEINNESRLSTWLVDKTLTPLTNETQIKQSQLHHQLSLLHRISGVETINRFKQGDSLGLSKLQIDLKDSKFYSAYVGADNFGNKHTSQYRGTAGVSLFNLAGLGDKLSFDLMSGGSSLNYGRVDYSLLLNGYGTRVGANYSALNYELGGESFKLLEAEGVAKQAGFYIQQPALITNNSELWLSLSYDHKQLEDDIRLTQYFKRRNIETIVSQLYGHYIDSFAGGGLTQYGASISFGEVSYKDAFAKFNDQITARTNGRFYSVSANYSRLQNLGSFGTQAYFSINGQYSPDNLDASEQYYSGGAYSVRGYKFNSGAGSSGYLTSLELRQPVYRNASSQLGVKAFVDSAASTINAKPWLNTNEENNIRLSSAGVGLNWQHRSEIQFNADIGFPFGPKLDSMDHRNQQRLWLSLRKGF